MNDKNKNESVSPHFLDNPDTMDELHTWPTLDTVRKDRTKRPDRI